MVGELAGHACDRRVRIKSAGATPVARHCLPVLSGIRRRAARGPMPSPTLFERIPPAARDIARWPFFLRPTSGSAGYPLADGSGKTGGSLADRRCMLSGVTGPSRMFSVLTEGCHVGYFREFVGTVYCTYGQSNTTNNSLDKWTPFRRRQIQMHFREWSFESWLKFHWSCFSKGPIDNNSALV